MSPNTPGIGFTVPSVVPVIGTWTVDFSCVGRLPSTPGWFGTSSARSSNTASCRGAASACASTMNVFEVTPPTTNTATMAVGGARQTQVAVSFPRQVSRFLNCCLIRTVLDAFRNWCVTRA
ncbi:hypothetical protein E0H45_38445 [Kribbella soli]|uniref:Uncharacterized protein n=1 Tax=Kribbella soli TaxID=1124743 RepID=A0A4R0GXT5_9ACTN|nr:hypothetical protein E0H45_38445 [Kribbella soli]